MPMTEEIATKCDLLDRMIEASLAAINTVDAAYLQYEASFEAVNLFILTIRHVEGVIALARADLVLLPAAGLTARGAFESSVRAAWMVNAADPFERETRWLAHLKTEEEHLSREIRLLGALEIASQERLATEASKWQAVTFQEHLNSIKDFRQGVASELEARGYDANVAVPHFRECLRSLGEERTYGLYMHLSQIAHATHAGTRLYRRGLGTKRISGEFVDAEDWNLPLDINLPNPAQQFWAVPAIVHSDIPIKQLFEAVELCPPQPSG
jgi:hypothetical protein